MILETGQQVDRYVVESFLGEGGMAVVYRVRHVDLGTLHAMKVLTLRTPSLQDRMLQEGRIQARVRHPNIVAVTDVARVDGAPGLVMELVEGPPLDHMLQGFRPDLAQVDDLVQGILRGVALAHARGLIHRDLKPANVLIVAEDDQVIPKVTDFGLAKVVTEEIGSSLAKATRTGMTMGTPTFMAPEQFRDAKNVDGRADVFSLGALLYEILTGSQAFVGSDPIQLHEDMTRRRWIPVRDLAPHAPERMAVAIERALEPGLDERPASVSELLELWRGEAWVPVRTPAWTRHDVARIRMLSRGIDPILALPSGDVSRTVDPTISESDEPTPTILPELAAQLTRPSEVAWPPPRSRLPVALGLALALALGAGATALGAWWLAPSPAPVVAAQETPPPEPAAEPAPAAVEEVVGSRDTVAAPSAPVREVVTAPRARPAPPPPVEPDDATASAEVDRPPPPAPDGARVEVAGAPEGAVLRDGRGGTVRLPATVPAGRYQLVVFFEPGVPTEVMDLDLEDGERRGILCTSSMRICR